MATIIAFLGHFHPLLVHLPIGILLSGIVFQWLSRTKAFASLKPAVSILFLWGALTALLSAITGFLLSTSDDYDDGLVALHQWMGIAVACLALVAYGKSKLPQWKVNASLLSALLFLAILFTGHLGGSLTHGPDYLIKPLRSKDYSDSSGRIVNKPISDVQNARAYEDVIKPILETKCYSCHGPGKQKGKLRLDNEPGISKGGKDGKVIEPGSADRSKIIQRLLLPVDNEDHMPPKEKPQPDERQIALLQWWINTGADFSKRVGELEQNDRTKNYLLSLQQVQEPTQGTVLVPQEKVDPADTSIIERLNRRGVVVLPVSQNSNYLSANFVNLDRPQPGDLDLLVKLNTQLIWLKLSNTTINDSDLSRLAPLRSLSRLSLDHTRIGDSGLAALKQFNNLEYLNLVGTSITAEGLMNLRSLPKLTSVFLYQTSVDNTGLLRLQKFFPRVNFDTGNYHVPTYVSDTTLVKKKT